MQFARWVSEVKPSFLPMILKATAQPHVISFAGGLPAPECFPVTEVARAVSEALDQQGSRLLQYSVIEGDPALRAALARHLTARSVPAGPEDILVTHGSQHGLDLVAKALLDPGDAVLVENPTYHGALEAFTPYRPRICPVACDSEGMLPEALAAAIRQERPKLVYVIPTFQNPRGTMMGYARREAITAICRDAGVVLVEDDPYSDLRYRGEPQPSLRHFWDQVVYLGTFSKTMAPGLRLGWVVAPPALLPAFKLGLQANALHAGTLVQRVAATVLESPAFPAHLAQLRKVYGERMAIMLEQLRLHFPAGTTWNEPEGGLFVWVDLPQGVKAMDLFHRAAEQGVALMPGQAFFAGEGGEFSMRLSFSNSTPEQLRGGMARLGRALAQLQTSR